MKNKIEKDSQMDVVNMLGNDTSYDKNELNDACKNKLNTTTKPYPDSINERQFKVQLKKNNGSVIEASTKSSQKTPSQLVSDFNYIICISHFFH